MEKQRVLVIGAGPAGLVSLKTLREQGYDAVCFEDSTDVGGTFVNKANYDDGKLVSSKYITPFSDFRLPASERDHQKTVDYIQYLNNYADHFKLRPHIRFQHYVTKVRKPETPAGEYTVEYCNVATGENGAERFECVCVCSGLHNVPYIPDIPGLDTFKGEVFHSSTYKDKAIFRNRRVVIVGCGETAMDLCVRSVQVADEVTLSARHGFLSVPTEWGPVALDTLITNLCECCYVHPWVETAHLKWKVTTVFIRLGFLLFTGSSWGYNQWTGRVKDIKRGYHIINKSGGAIKYLNKRAKEESWYGGMYRWLDGDVPKGIETMPGIEHISGNTVTFTDGRAVEADMIVLATGYTQRFPFLYDRGEATSEGEDPLPTERFVVNASEPRLGFIGFCRPNVGAIPPMAELQVMWWIQRMRGGVRMPLTAPLYGLLAMRRVYGVDYGLYMHQLANDMGAAPDLMHWVTRPRVLLAYALGQAYITFFRLEGPYADPKAIEISETELFKPVVDRGLLANLVFIGIILVFGYINAVALIVSTLWDKFMALASPAPKYMSKKYM